MATLSISYYDLGYTTGEMAVRVLKGEADISQMPIEYTSTTKKDNAAICQELGLTVPEGYEDVYKRQRLPSAVHCRDHGCSGQ